MGLVARLLNPSGWDWGSVADWIVALAAVVSGLLVIRQLTGLRDDRRRADEALHAQAAQSLSEANSARANLLLRIDERFSGPALIRSRKRWLELRAESRADFTTSGRPQADYDDFVRAAMVERINRLWDDVQRGGVGLSASVRAYDAVMQLASWMETVGLLVRQGLVPVRDIELLYHSVIRSTIAVIAGHVAHRDPGPNPTSFENAIWLNRQFAP